MTLMRSFLVLVLSLTALSFTEGCAGKRKGASTTTIFVHGDPFTLFAKTETSPSFLTPNNIANFKDFHFSNAVVFVEQEPQAAPTTYAQVEKDNATDTSKSTNSEFDLLKYEFVQIDATRFVYRPVGGAKGYVLGFALQNGFLVMTDYDGYPVTAQHYSLKADGKSFSILVSQTIDFYGKVVSAFEFASSEKVNPITNASKDFAFLFDTAKLTWSEPINVQACGTFDETTQNSIDASVKAWFADTSPTAATRPVTYTKRTSYAPFSDLNQHCIYLISTFKLENSVDFFTAGVTLPVINFASKEIVDSDVMIFTSHPQIALQFAKGAQSAVLLHEMGHFYGLGHEFKKDAAGKALHPSIMGYSTGTNAITAWDFDAIRDLYTDSLGPTP
ncbi:MAG: hypothetical protein H7249_15320 [Chitinophagaceae bacterium]|nr:hypothetical protein [Oligoflexus sp.]